MRSFFLFLGLLAVSLVLGAALTYPAWQLVGLFSVEPVHRVMHRVAMLFALIGLVVLTRRLKLYGRESLGYAIPAAAFARQSLVGWLVGLALMVPLVVALIALDIRVAPTLNGLIVIIASGILSGIVVSLIEETFFRGVLYTAIARTSGVGTAIVVPSLLYAALHFLGGHLRVPLDAVSWHHGFDVLANLFERYQDPLSLVDSFLTLFLVGVLLSLVRLRTGSIAASVGLHAAGVTVIAVLREVTVPNRQGPLGYLVGSYDGVIGWLALLWFVIIAVAYTALTREPAGMSQPSKAMTNGRVRL